MIASPYVAPIEPYRPTLSIRYYTSPGDTHRHIPLFDILLIPLPLSQRISAVASLLIISRAIPNSSSAAIHTGLTGSVSQHPPPTTPDPPAHHHTIRSSLPSARPHTGKGPDANGRSTPHALRRLSNPNSRGSRWPSPPPHRLCSSDTLGSDGQSNLTAAKRLHLQHP